MDHLQPLRSRLESPRLELLIGHTRHALQRAHALRLDAELQPRDLGESSLDRVSEQRVRAAQLADAVAEVDAVLSPRGVRPALLDECDYLRRHAALPYIDRKSTRLNSSHSQISYA